MFFTRNYREEFLKKIWSLTINDKGLGLSALLIYLRKITYIFLIKITRYYYISIA